MFRVAFLNNYYGAQLKQTFLCLYYVCTQPLQDAGSSLRLLTNPAETSDQFMIVVSFTFNETTINTKDVYSSLITQYPEARILKGLGYTLQTVTATFDNIGI